ncbi:hypothetical protein ACFE04_016005 [Oxalis oulophora]
MVVSNTDPCCCNHHDLDNERKDFDETKDGVKGVADSGLTKIPRIFLHKNLSSNQKPSSCSEFTVPTVDLDEIGNDPNKRSTVVEGIRNACEKWGFFQLVGHGIPVETLDEMIDGIRRFHEQESEIRRGFYSRDLDKKVIYLSNFQLYKSAVADWRDSIAFRLAPNPPDPREFPQVCRDIVMDYSSQVKTLGLTLFELLSEALGLKPNHLKDIDLAEGLLMMGHYYPPCPEPELTMATSSHFDSNFITLLLQDQIGGLQVLHENQWVDVPSKRGALVVNMGDLIQASVLSNDLISNDKFKSVNHRVLAKNVGPRISAVCFFRTEANNSSNRLYGPVEELLSDENPAVYRDTTVKDYLSQYYSRGMHAQGTSALSYFKI